MTDATAVLYDAVDARRFLAERPDAARILALTPNARAPFLGSGIPILASSSVYRAYAHRRSLARVQRAKLLLMPAIRQAGLSPSVSETLRGIFEMVGAMTARAYSTLGQGPWLFPTSSGWEEVVHRDAAHDALLRRLALEPGWPPYRRAPASFAVTLVNRLIALLLSRRTSFVFCNADKGFADVIDDIAGRGSVIVAVNLHPALGTWRDLARSCLGLWRALVGGRIVPMTVSPDRTDERIVQTIENTLAAIQDPVLNRGIEVFSGSLVGGGVEAHSMQAPLVDLISRLKPLALLTYSLRWRFEAALGEAAGRVGIQRWLVSHGSHPVPDGATSAAALDGHAEGLLVSRLADVAFPQSPQAARAASRLMPALPRCAVLPAVWGHTVAGCRETPVFRVLQAGTLKSWRDHRPWMYETSDEFVDGLVALAMAFQALGPGFQLMIRVREASECSLATLRMLVPEGSNVSIKTDGDFLDDLAESDLLVSHSSTTIEEALTARRPVLLFGGGCPYRHLAAETVTPTLDSRAAVYAVDDAAALPHMIAAIKEAHRGRPLTNIELADFIWPETTGRLADRIAAFIRSGDTQALTDPTVAIPGKQNG